ncbi:MAG: hypothetical protein PXX73_03135 [Sideroxydans sp.]|nr:hypothetical protein [Sideroxydans sp.]
MQAIEFNSQLEHGQIAVPKAFHLHEGQALRVLILLDEKTTVRRPQTNLWGQTSGAWQGELLVREPQGEYESRLELK